MSDEPLVECPKCGGKLAKQWSRTGFQFKGTGWYVTDYAAKGAEAKSAAKAESGENKTETKTESKTTETKTETNASGDSGAAKTSSGGESTAGANAASKPETKSSASD